MSVAGSVAGEAVAVAGGHRGFYVMAVGEIESGQVRTFAAARCCCIAASIAATSRSRVQRPLARLFALSLTHTVPWPRSLVVQLQLCVRR